MIASERLTQNGYVIEFAGEYSYDTAPVGVTEVERAVCDSDKMVTWPGEHDSADERMAMERLEHDILSVW